MFCLTMSDPHSKREGARGVQTMSKLMYDVEMYLPDVARGATAALRLPCAHGPSRAASLMLP